jgi:hypothetical protein
MEVVLASSNHLLAGAIGDFRSVGIVAFNNNFIVNDVDDFRGSIA